MRKTVPMQPADVAAWTEIARIAAEKLQDMFQRDKWAPPTQPRNIPMKKPDIGDWMEWANKTRTIGATLPTFAEAALLMHERTHAMYGHLSDEVPDECRVVSLMQNEGE